MTKNVKNARIKTLKKGGYSMSKEIEDLKVLKAKIGRLMPSEEKVWLKHYQLNAEELCADFPDKETLWDFIEKKLIEFEYIPAMRYLRKTEFSRPEFRELVYQWARTFRGLGVEPDEVVPIYAPFIPGVAIMMLALNAIGASTNFLKLGIPKDDLERLTEDSKVFVVFDGAGLYSSTIHNALKDSRFKNIIVTSAYDHLENPFRSLVQIKTMIDARKSKSYVPKDDKRYIWYDKALEMAAYYTGDPRVPFMPNRTSVITSSSGTTGNVKMIMASNESVLHQLRQAQVAKVPYKPGGVCFANLPLTASTANDCLLLLPLMYGMTIEINPQFSEKKFLKQVLEIRPQVSVATGSFWEAFFKEYEKMGKKPSLDFFDAPIMGGEGNTPEKIDWMNRLLKENGATTTIMCGYGQSETFAPITFEKLDIELIAPQKERGVSSVGIPFPGFIVGVFDENGNELGYNQPGELRVKSRAIMKGYYKDDKLTDETIINGWLRTGDQVEMDEDGVVYFYDRIKNLIEYNGELIPSAVIAFYIRKDKAIDNCIVRKMPLEDGTEAIVAHIELTDTKDDLYSILSRTDERLKEILPKGFEIAGYRETELCSSPTTGKKNYPYYDSQLFGYSKSLDEKLYDLIFSKDEITANHTMQYSLEQKGLTLSLRKK